MTHIFVNLPTADLEQSTAFYTALGAEINPLFTDENAACLVWDENVVLMMVTREFLSTFTEKGIADPRTTAQVLTAFSRESREHVDQTVEAGLAAGGAETRPVSDLGFMYTRHLEDPDGNIVEFFHMVPEAVEQGPAAYMAEQA